jgi:Homeodomain-like domain
MRKGRRGRSPDQIRKDRAEIARLYLQRMTQSDIGARLGLSRQQIGYDLEAVRQAWLQSSLMDFNTRKAEELTRIDALEREHLPPGTQASRPTKRPRPTRLRAATTSGSRRQPNTTRRAIPDTWPGYTQLALKAHVCDDANAVAAGERRLLNAGWHRSHWQNASVVV